MLRTAQPERPILNPEMTGTKGDDTMLMAQVAAGDRGEPMEEICRRYTPRIYALGMRLTGDRGMSEELVQDTFLRLWRSAPRYDAGVASVKTFIYTLARRAAVDLQRRPASRPLPVGDGVTETTTVDPAAEERINQVILGLEVRDALGALSEKHREALVLCFDEDLSRNQMSERLDVPLGTVKTRIHHALLALRAELEERQLVNR